MTVALLVVLLMLTSSYINYQVWKTRRIQYRVFEAIEEARRERPPDRAPMGEYNEVRGYNAALEDMKRILDHQYRKFYEWPNVFRSSEDTETAEDRPQMGAEA